ncbi:MAG: hypothetical protein AAF423_04920, partial [Pseudomonadota bacterium]
LDAIFRMGSKIPSNQLDTKSPNFHFSGRFYCFSFRTLCSPANEGDGSLSSFFQNQRGKSE